MSDTKLLDRVVRFDRTNWEKFRFSFWSMLLYMDALDILKGTSSPPAALTATSTPEDKKAYEEWHRKAHQGNALLLTSVGDSVHHSLDEDKNLQENWKSLEDMYGMHTGINL